MVACQSTENCGDEQPSTKTRFSFAQSRKDAELIGGKFQQKEFTPDRVGMKRSVCRPEIISDFYVGIQASHD
jgi:hypothetical protein